MNFTVDMNLKNIRHTKHRKINKQAVTVNPWVKLVSTYRRKTFSHLRQKGSNSDAQLDINEVDFVNLTHENTCSWSNFIYINRFPNGMSEHLHKRACSSLIGDKFQNLHRL